MTPTSSVFFRTCDRAALWAAAVLVPRSRRAEWLREWRSELWHVRAHCGADNGLCLQAELQVAAFCRGAFRDALLIDLDSWTPAALEQRLRSATSCIASLAALALAAYVLAMCMPGARVALRRSPYRDPQNLMLVTSARYPGTSVPTVRAEEFRSWKNRTQSLFDDFAFYQPLLKYVKVAPHQSAELSVARSSRNLFDLLGLPVRFTANGNMPGLVVTDHAWRTYFGGAPQASGRIVKVGLRRAEVIAVLPEQLWVLPGKVDAWLIEPDEDAVAIPSRASGFVVAHLLSSPAHALLGDDWNFSVPTSSGAADDFRADSLSGRAGQPFDIFVFTFLLALLALPATTPLSLGEYPSMPHKTSASTSLRRWMFLAAKVSLVLPVVYFGSVDLAYCSIFRSPISCQYAQIVGSFCAGLFALRWIWRDQRRRCPRCLGKLSNPARVGQPSRNFLSWNGTELICAEGHGLLHVPEMPTSWFSTQRWLYLDASWDFLFVESYMASRAAS